MNSLIKFFRLAILTAILLLSAGISYSQTDEQVVSYFVKDQLDVKDNQTVFNVLKVKNTTERSVKVQINFTLPTDWDFYSDRTHFLELRPNEEIGIPIRIAPSAKAKGGVGYALNATMLSIDGKFIASKYCFLRVPVKTKLDINFSNLSYYLDHRYGKGSLALKIKNSGNSNRLLSLRLYCDERIDFTETGQNELISDLSLEAGKDTIIRTNLRFNDMIDNISYFNKPLIAEISSSDTMIERYSFIKYLDYKYRNIIEDNDQPLVVELSALDILNDVMTFRLMAMGKVKFKNQRNISYYYRSITAPIDNIPSWKYDEYFVRYNSRKTTLEAGNLRDNYSLSLFGPGIKYNQYLTKNTYAGLTVQNDIYSRNTMFGGTFGTKTKKNNYYASYLKMISDTSHNPYMDIYCAGGSLDMGKIGFINLDAQFNQYNGDEHNKKSGHYINANYSNNIGRRMYLYMYMRNGSPYSASFNHGRHDINLSINYNINRRNYIQTYYSRFKYQPASIYNNLDEGLNYKYHNAKLLYNYVLAQNSILYIGPNYDLGTSNYYNNSLAEKTLRLSSKKLEMGYRFNPNLYALQSLNINVQVGQVKPLSYNEKIYTEYSKKSNVLKFSATIQGKRWGVYGMYYTGLYNMSMALTNFYTGTAGKYLYFMPYFRITSANKRFYYEIRFSYLNNIDLKTTRTSIMQEAGADMGKGWSVRVLNNTNIQSLQDATGQSYRYTNNYMELSLRKVFSWNQPGQKYHTLRTVFYRDLNGDRIMGKNEPGVENVVMSITNNSTIDTSYHYTGEMFGNIDVASNFKGLTVYENIPEAEYMINYQPTDEETERFSIANTGQLVNLTRDTTIYVPFVERNLVFGTVKFNRAKRSSIQEIKLDGIKVSITDSHGYSWYAFTDQSGYYEIFAPVADFYTVQIANNLWSEYFDLRQDKYIIKFNGYKRFEVNFEFDEKKREIKFDDVVDINDIVSGENFRYEDVTQIKQTILRGTISDATTLAPIQATIEVIDLSRHDVVAKLKSSSSTGSFFTTFITGRNYQLKITAPGYWVHQEPLSSDQLTTFETINRDGLLLNKIVVGKSMDLNNLGFELNSADLTPEAKAELENVVILLANNEKVSINVIGLCSNDETDPNSLSSRRARKVVEFLSFRGISIGRITYEGHGAVDKNHDKAQYRKVEIIVTGNK